MTLGSAELQVSAPLFLKGIMLQTKESQTKRHMTVRQAEEHDTSTNRNFNRSCAQTSVQRLCDGKWHTGTYIVHHSSSAQSPPSLQFEGLRTPSSFQRLNFTEFVSMKKSLTMARNFSKASQARDAPTPAPKGRHTQTRRTPLFSLRVRPFFSSSVLCHCVGIGCKESGSVP